MRAIATLPDISAESAAPASETPSLHPLADSTFSLRRSWPAEEPTRGFPKGITVLLATPETISPDFEKGLIDAIYAARGEDDTNLRIFTLLEAPQVKR
jgi:hypothetical protein